MVAGNCKCGKIRVATCSEIQPTAVDTLTNVEVGKKGASSELSRVSSIAKDESGIARDFGPLLYLLTC